MSEIKVVIYGASVSAQSKDDSYWLKLSESLLRYNLDQGNEGQRISLFRLVYPSSHISDAGIANFDILISLDPDIVILDWLSTDEAFPCRSSLLYIYNELCDRGVKIITTAFPRLDSISSPTESYLYTRHLSSLCTQSFVDVIEYCNANNLSWSDVTRDGVHTNSFGAALYSNLVFKAILGLIIPTSPSQESFRQAIEASPAYLEDPVKPYISIGSRIIGRELTITPSQCLLLKLDIPPSFDAAAGNRISILCKQSIGPFSRQCCGSLGNLHSEICLYDQWCHFTRFAYKPLLTMENAPEGVHTLKITVSIDSPESLFPLFNPDAASKIKLLDCPAEAPLLRLHDRLVAINCAICSLEIL